MIPFGLTSLMTVSMPIGRRATKCLPPGAVALYLPTEEGRNLMPYSQQFDVGWAKVQATVNGNVAIAPDGTMTADGLTETTVSGGHYCYKILDVPTANVCFSVYAKAGSRPWVSLRHVCGGAAYFDLVNGVAGSVNVGCTSSIMPVGDGWYRCSITGIGMTGTYFAIYTVIDNLVQSHDGDAALYPNGTYIWGAQVEVGSVPTTYYPTTDKQILSDYANRSRNLLLPNQANAGEDGTTFGISAWNGGATITSSTEQALSGSRSIKVAVTSDETTKGMSLRGYLLKPGVAYTFSCYIRGSGGTVRMGYYNPNTGYVLSATHTLTGDWVRLSMVYTPTVERTMDLVIHGPTPAMPTWYVDQLQLEEGSVATEWQAPPNHGILGSSLGADTNDPTWVRGGLSYDADDYVKFGPISDGTGTVQPMGAMVTAFYVPSPVSAASAKSCSFALAPNAAIYLGAVAGAPANNIVTVQYAAGSYTSWCDAAATITAGWHTLAVAWNGTTYDLYLDGAMLPTTTAGTPALLSPTAAFCCYDGTTYGPGIVRAARGIWARSLGAGELAQARAYLKNHLEKFGVVLP